MLSAACITTPLPGVPVQEVDPAAVRGCTWTTDLEVTAMRDSGSPAADLQRVKELLLSQARERGATHLVVTERDLRFALALARGSAYRCG
ncbi:hypothetical protein A4W93_21215 [Piscinibacter gummiphilus]|uniref:Uncharacterized protein n=1 Tax=Piscinibacter gummiphilus TaxID=946333 RepID=A0A1W6LD59_9BURK|nr:hypothetical protein A4W93_21215 [Piscinibacter gummiphilus]ATU66904.1 hypothetical protein CPZ87_21315 [Piscinibacter gummiphilus]GLS94316.1 hypothetical protein GCM10007918_16080 [Piscinibacter gummiphilus]